MTAEKPDRRIQRTRDLLRRALMQLIREKGYDAITIQDITRRANLGRTTFYLHYESKDALLLDHHEAFASSLMLRPLNREEILSDLPPSELEQFLREMDEGKAIYYAIKRAQDSEVILRGIRQQMAAALCESLNRAFPDTAPSIPLEVLSHYVIGGQLTLIEWWLMERTGYDAGQLAVMLHQLQRNAICDAYKVQRS